MENTSRKEIFLTGIIKQNPVLVMLLGCCPALAVTTKVSDAIGMMLAFALVLIVTNVVVSLIRRIVPGEIRIPVYIVIIASTVTMVEMLVNAFAFSVAQSLGLFLPLIVVNCIVFGRAEAFAAKNGPLDSLVDALSMAIGFGFALILTAFFRELLATGGIAVNNPLNGQVIFDTKSWFVDPAYYAYSINPIEGITKAGGAIPDKPALVYFRERIALPIFQTPTGAFLAIGFIIASVNAISGRKSKKKEVK